MTKPPKKNGKKHPSFPRPDRPTLLFVPPPEMGLPYSEEAEAAALGSVLLAGNSDSQSGAEAMLQQLRTSYFHDLRHRKLFEEFVAMRMDNHAIDIPCVISWLKGKKLLEQMGGVTYVSELDTKTPSLANFKYHLDVLKEMSHRRWLLLKGEELKAMASAQTVSIDTTKERIGDLFDATARTSGEKMIDVITPKEARSFVPDENDFLVGKGLISREMFLTVGGEPGCGKSRLATTLAVAGARGYGKWMGYPVRAKFQSLILQTENKGNRLKEEFDAVPVAYDGAIKVSRNLPHGLAFSNPDFRRELLRLYEEWPFQLLVIDPWNDVCADEGQSDYKDSLLNIQRCFQGHKMPAVLIVAHLRKPRTDASGRRKSGRELLHELSGSLALGSTSRTVFAVQPATSGMDDDRIVFEVAKANDADPAWLKEHGTRSAWHRCNGAFEDCADFDWDQWTNPAEKNEERRAVTVEMLRKSFGERMGMKQGELVKAIAEKFDVGTSTVWRAIGKDGYLRKHLTETAGIVALQ